MRLAHRAGSHHPRRGDNLECDLRGTGSRATQETTPLPGATTATAYLFASAFPEALLFVSHDGARIWHQVRLPERDAGGLGIGIPVSFVDARDGYFLGARLYRTTTGGGTWTVVPSDLPPVGAVLQFVSMLVGFAISRDASDVLHLYRTDNGGLHWVELRVQLP